MHDEDIDVDEDEDAPTGLNAVVVFVVAAVAVPEAVGVRPAPAVSAGLRQGFWHDPRRQEKGKLPAGSASHNAKHLRHLPQEGWKTGVALLLN